MKKLFTEINGKQVEIIAPNPNTSEYDTDKKQIFIIGSKGIPASYGGFETFVENLTEYKKSSRIRYHVARISTGNDDSRYFYNDAKCFTVPVPNIGAAKAIIYDIVALNTCIKYCKSRKSIETPVFYVLACRIGPFMWYFKRKIKKLNGVLYVNPDGHEWKRKKWSKPVKMYWKFSEKHTVKNADLLICDSKNIEKYIKKTYKKYSPKTTYISYGTDTEPSLIRDNNPEYTKIKKRLSISPGNYYLIVGRFVPENNFKLIIREFMKSNTKKDLVIITTNNDKLRENLSDELHYNSDKRIKFSSPVYNTEILKKIREDAYGYIHGHEVGGTNPSLLEAMAYTGLNLLFNVSFTREVAEDSGLYFTSSPGNLSSLIESADNMTHEDYNKYKTASLKRVKVHYSWDSVVDKYEDLFLNSKN